MPIFSGGNLHPSNGQPRQLCSALAEMTQAAAMRVIGEAVIILYQKFWVGLWHHSYLRYALIRVKRKAF